MTCRLLRFIGHTEYLDRKGRPKVVAYWVMAPIAGDSSPPTKRSTNCAGMGLERASHLLSYPRDRELIAVLQAADQVEPLIWDQSRPPGCGSFTSF